jgi:hypothetical protein
MGDAHLLRLEERRNWSRSRTGAHCQRRRRHPCHRGDTGVSQRRRPMFTAHSARTGCRLFRRACLPCSCYKACLATPPLPFRSAPLLPPPHPFLLRLLASSASASTPPRPASASRSLLLLLLLASAPGQPPPCHGAAARARLSRVEFTGRRPLVPPAAASAKMDAGEMEDVRAAAAAEEVISSRGGSVLGKKTILKSDHFPGCQNKRLSPQIDGAPNYRQVRCFASLRRRILLPLSSVVLVRLAFHLTSPLSGWDGWGCTCTGRRISSHSSVAPGRKLLQSPAPAPRRHSLLWLSETIRLP